MTQINKLFALLRTVICEAELAEEAKGAISPDELAELFQTSAKYDVDHLVALALKRNALAPTGSEAADKIVFRAVYRYRQLKYE